MNKIKKKFIFIFIFFIISCSKKEIKPDQNWIKTTDFTYINQIKNNNSNLKSFKAKFYLTENIKKMALSGNIFFDRNNKDFFITLTDVLVSSDILTMKKNNEKLLLFFHRDNKKYIEDFSSVKLSKYEFAIEIDELIKFISLEIPLINTEEIYEQLKNDTIIYKLQKKDNIQYIFFDKLTKRVRQIDYIKNGNDYSIQYQNYENFNNFYYPEKLKILNYTNKQRVFIKVEKIEFIDKLSKDIFRF